MADTSDSQVRMDDNTPKAAKDKECPYCQQAFTSSSLGRHLDLYIKPRNPKKPDGIHDVEEIRRTRGGVTRRQPKGFGARRQTSTPAATPAGPSSQQRNDDSEGDESMVQSPSKEASTPAPATSAAGFPIGRGNRWEAVNTTTQQKQQQQQQQQELSGTPSAAAAAGGSGERSRGGSSARNLNRQAQKAQLDMKQKLQDAQDDARAAEMAFREIAQALHSAQQRVEIGNSPFPFDPVTLDFPALTLQCLPAMPTLFALTQLPTPSSWSTLPPGDGQFESLKAHFKTEYQKFKAKCVAQAEAQHAAPRHADERQKAIELAETKADDLERTAMEHLDGAYASWNQLSPERKTELWVLNLARGLATKQKENEQQAAENSRLTQESAGLKSQMERLARQSNPREPQATAISAGGLPISNRLLHELRTAGVVVPGFDNSTFDSDTFVASTIKRWKGVVTSDRLSTTGMSAQRPLEISMTTGPATPSAAERGTPSTASQTTRTRLGPVKFSNSTPESLAQTGGAQRQQRKGVPGSTGRQPVPSGSRSKAASASASAPASAATTATTAPAAPTAPATMNAPPAPRTPVAPVAPGEASAPQVRQQPSQPTVETKTEPGDDAMDVEVEDAEADEEEEDEEEEEEEEDDDEDAEEAEDDDDDEDGDDDTTPPAQQPQQAPAGPGAAGGGAPGGGSNANADDNDDEDDEMSDKDADAEMEDDGDEFAHMHTPLNMSMSSTGSEHQHQQPEFAYSRRNAAQQIPRTAGNTSASLINSGRLMSSMGLSMPSISSESMYMD